MSFFNTIGSLLEGVGEFLPMISAGSQLIGGGAAYSNAREQSKDMTRLASREAQRTIASGQIEAQQIQSQGFRTVGIARARVGASGFQLRGSTLDVIANSYANIEIDRLNTIYNSRREAALINERASYAAKATRQDGTASLTRGIGAAALTLSGSGLFSSKEGIDDIARS
jgi:hypothetical protein